MMPVRGRRLRVWIVGQKSFGAAVFQKLEPQSHVRVVGVTAPVGDKLYDLGVKNRLIWTDSRPQPDKIKILAGTDLIINAHGHAKIPAEVRDAATYGAVGYHPSLLPRHRGRSAVEWTIAMGDRIAGGTVYRLDDGYDSGPILLQDWCHVRPEWSASDLWRERLFPMGVSLLDAIVWTHAHVGMMQGREQDENLATYESPWSDLSGNRMRTRVKGTV